MDKEFLHALRRSRDGRLWIDFNEGDSREIRLSRSLAGNHCGLVLTDDIGFNMNDVILDDLAHELTHARAEYALEHQPGYEAGVHDVSLDKFLATVAQQFYDRKLAQGVSVESSQRKKGGMDTVKVPDFRPNGPLRADSPAARAQAQLCVNEVMDYLHGQGLTPGHLILNHHQREKLVQTMFNFIGALRMKAK